MNPLFHEGYPLFHMRISESSVVDVSHFKPITIPQKLSCLLANEKCTECSTPLVPYASVEKRVPIYLTYTFSYFLNYDSTLSLTH